MKTLLYRSYLYAVLFLFTISQTALSQAVFPPFTVPFTSADFLNHSVDPRATALGNTGVATSPDAASGFWNAGKLAFNDDDFGVTASYMPWVPKFLDNYWRGYASAYKKLGDRQAVSFSFQNFNLKTYGDYKPREMAVSTTYSRKLTNHLALGATIKYVRTNVAPWIFFNNTATANTLAADLGLYYTRTNQYSGSAWNVGAVLMNLGGKLDYGRDTTVFLPATFKLGGGWNGKVHEKGRLGIYLDVQKLLVSYGSGSLNRNAIGSVFASFSDAPFKRQVQEIVYSGGIEYAIQETVFLRGGYFHEHENNGGRKYFTTGAGLRLLKRYQADFSYLIPTKSNTPLKNSWQIGVTATFGSK